MKCNQLRLGFELVLPCPFPTPITITLRSPLGRPTEKDWESLTVSNTNKLSGLTIVDPNVITVLPLISKTKQIPVHDLQLFPIYINGV